MDIHPELDAARCSRTNAVKCSRHSFALIACLALGSLARAQTECEANGASVRHLFEQQRWEDVVRCYASSAADSSGSASANSDYFHGMALARLERWEEARAAFEAGAAKAPDDSRFPLELAGIAFRFQSRAAALPHLRRALRIEPESNYTNNFLGTLYFLDGNLDAALKYWNRAARPFVEEVSIDPRPRLDPVLLDRALAFSPASVLTLEDLDTSRARLDLMGVFPASRIELNAQEDGTFNLNLRVVERSGWGASGWSKAIGLLRGLPYQTVHGEYFNLGGDATNFRSQLRWDSDKRRAFVELAGPLAGEPSHRYRAFFDGRDENWRVLGESGDPAAASSFGFERQEAGFDVTSVVSGRLSWTTGLSFSHRRFQDADAGTADPGLFSSGWLAKAHAGVEYRVLRFPERRITVDSSATSTLGKRWTSKGLFLQPKAELRFQWFPQAESDDYETTLRLRSGTTPPRRQEGPLDPAGLLRRPFGEQLGLLALAARNPRRAVQWLFWHATRTMRRAADGLRGAVGERDR